MATETQTQLLPHRPLRGSRISTFYPVKSLPTLSSLDSAFQLQEYISLLIRLDVHDVETITSLPGAGKEAKERESAEGGDKESSEEGRDGEGEKERDITVDEACWIYEQLRRLAQDLTHPLITTLQQECSRTTCPEMKAGEWLYLCVAHGNEGAMEQCCAIDYILHTLDSATALLNSPRAFPSRLQIPTSSHRHFSSLARRLGRIFAHAYFHHREAFEQAEAESSLYARFLALTSKFDLVPSEFLVIPSIADDDQDEDAHSRDSGFGLRGVGRGTSYDPQRRQGHASIQHQLPSSFQDDFPDVPRARRLPLQHLHQQYQQHQQQQPEEIQTQVQQVQPGSGTESPKKVGRNRTHTMVLSETVGVVDDLAKAAAAKAEEEKQRKEREEEQERAQEVQVTEKVELEATASEAEIEVTPQVEQAVEAEVVEAETEPVLIQDVHETVVELSPADEPSTEEVKTGVPETQEEEDVPSKADVDVPVDVDIAEEGISVQSVGETEVLPTSEEQHEKEEETKVEEGGEGGEELSDEVSSEGKEGGEEGEKEVKDDESGEDVKLSEDEVASAA